METIGLRINGKNVIVKPGVSILDAAMQNGIEIPTLCHHPDLKPHGACRLCLVEDENTGRLFASCVTPVSEGMSVLTHTPRIIEHRKTIVSLIMAAHPDSCLVCAKGNDCDLRKIASDLGLGARTLYPMPQYRPQDQSNPFIYRDITKCILCGKCIRGCKERVVTGTLEYSLRGFDSKPVTALDTPLSGSDCTFCGTCVTLCPTGALLPATASGTATPFLRKESVCGFCGAGCRVSLGVNGQRIGDVKPSEMPGSVNGVTLCVRGHFGLDFLESPARLTRPQRGRGEDRAEVDWDTALSEVTDRLAGIKEQYGPEAIGFYGSSKCSNEENYLFQKIARAGLGTNNIDNGGAIYGREGLMLMRRLTGGGARRFADIEQAQVVVVAGADPENTVPVLNYHIKRAVLAGAYLIVINPRSLSLVRHADVWLKPGPGADTDGFYQNVVRCLSDCLDTGGDDERTRECGALSEQMGMDEALIYQAAELITGKRVACVLGEDLYAVRDAEAWARLSARFGCADGKGAGLHLMVRENNLIGSWDMGTVPAYLPGHVDLSVPENRKPFEKAWGKTLSGKPGMDIGAMIRAAEKGTLKALYMMGENPLRSLPQPARVRKALEKLDFLVVQDILATETSDLAHLVLPGAAFTEKSGSFTSMEGRLQTFERAVAPPGQARSDWSLLAQLALSLGLNSDGLNDVRHEIETLVPAYTGLSGPRAMLWPRWEKGFETKPSAEVLADEREEIHPEFPVTAWIASSHFQAGSGTRTGQSSRLSRAPDRSAVRIPGDLARRLGLTDGQAVRIISAGGEITRPFLIDPALTGDLVMIPRAFNANDVMNLLSFDHQDASLWSGTHLCRIRIEQAERI